jgi:septal ring factor EnvC (AmiA/AmiB activator)
MLDQGSAAFRAKSERRPGKRSGRSNLLKTRFKRLKRRLKSGEAKVDQLTLQRDAMSARLDDMSARLNALEVAWKQNITEFLNAVATVPALSYQLLELRRTFESRLAATGEGLAVAREETAPDIEARDRLGR